MGRLACRLGVRIVVWLCGIVLGVLAGVGRPYGGVASQEQQVLLVVSTMPVGILSPRVIRMECVTVKGGVVDIALYLLFGLLVVSI
jgi:hypothetical protein